MLIPALKIVLSNSSYHLQSLLQDLETREFQGKVKEILDEQIELSRQAHALLEDFVTRMEKK